jgi:glucose-6-phosphate isomerase
VTDAGLKQQLRSQRLVSRLWARDPAPFLGTGASPDAIRQRLGWLAAPAAALAVIPRLTGFADLADADGLTDVVLLGMGGSSLGAEVLRDVPGLRRGTRRFTVLDTTDESAILEVTGSLVPDRTLVVVASKSGTTTEVEALEEWFWQVISRARGANAGRHFVAITDPGTPLVDLATERGYRDTFLNAPDIGGRYSVLSLFGLVPAALIGRDLDALVASASAMASRCRADTDDNEALSLGAFMAACASSGRDKLTLLLPPELAPLGAWIEQLVAESTGKDGRGILPVVDEPAGEAAVYGDDRMFVVIGDRNRWSDIVGSAPVFQIAAPGPGDLGGEFFRWEFATAITGAALGINPFDEPNVKEAKARTAAQLESRRTRGAFSLTPPFEKRDGVAIRSHDRPDGLGTSGQYLAILDYVPANQERASRIAAVRSRIRSRTRFATTYGIGPRYLHSTGQFHKGGPNRGIFVILTADDATETPVPGKDYSFSVLKHAQALGDFDALAAAGRRVVHCHFPSDADPTAMLEGLLPI